MSAPPRVVIATPFESALTHRGNRLPALAAYLAARGETVRYLTTTFDHALKTHSSPERVAAVAARLPYRLEAFRVPGYRTNVSVARVVCHRVAARRYARRLRRDLAPGDVAIVPGRPPELVAAATREAGRKGAAVVQDTSDVWPDMLAFLGGWRYAAFRRYCEHYLRRGVPRTAAHVVTAPDFEGWVRRYSPAADVRFIPLGYDGERWRACRAHAAPARGALSLVYVGLLQRQIDLSPVLAAMQGRSGVRLTVIGDGGEGERHSAFVEEARARGVAVRMAGRLAPDAVPGELMAHDIGLVPMVSSSLPNKLFDYLGAYLPVLALGDGAAARFVEDHGVGWAAPFDGPAVGRTLDAIGADGLGARGARVAEVRPAFDRDVLYARYLELIEELRERMAVRSL